MASKKISELSAATSVGDSDLFVIVSSGVNYKATKAKVVEGLPALASVNTFTKGQVIQTGGASTVGLTIKGAVSQSASLLSLKNSSDVVKFAISGDGSVTTAGNIALLNTFNTFRSINVFSSPATTDIPITSEGVAGQLAALIVARDSDLNNLFMIHPNGGLCLDGSILTGSDTILLSAAEPIQIPLYDQSNTILGYIRVSPAD